MLRIQTHQHTGFTHWGTERHRWSHTDIWHWGWSPFEMSACYRSGSGDTEAHRLQSR